MCDAQPAGCVGCQDPIRKTRIAAGGLSQKGPDSGIRALTSAGRHGKRGACGESEGELNCLQQCRGDPQDTRLHNTHYQKG